MTKATKTRITVIDEGSGLKLGDRFTPDFGRPLNHLSVAGARAYAVNDVNGNDEDFYCLMCEPGTYVRHAAIVAQMEKSPRNIRLPQAATTVRLNDGRHFFAIVLDHARARPVREVFGKKVIPEKDLTQRILPELIACLGDLGPASICHRSIRPDTVLITPEGTAILDQCIIGLPGENQPPAFEPIMSAQATPGGRGEGSPSDDYFALGVTTLDLLSGREPGEGLSREALWVQRLLRGSYVALMERRKFTTATQALLAGTLADGSHRRWNVDGLKAWSGGHWDMPRPSGGGRRAPRPFLFDGRDHLCPELLAWALFGNIPEAAKVIVAGRIEKWVRNVLEDSRAADVIETAMRPFMMGEPVSDKDAAELVCRVCFALDPAGPLRYRDLILSPTGIPGAIWTAMQTGDQDRLRSLSELLSSTLLPQWQNTGSRMVRAALPNFVTSTINSIMMEQGKAGFGLERVLYEMLPRTACISPRVAASMPLTLADLMLALERLAESDPEGVVEPDRHIAGFILAKDRNTETAVRAINSQGSSIERLTAMGDLLGMVQRNHLPQTTPALSRAIANALKPAMNALRSRVRRMVLQQKTEALAEGGDLSALTRELDVSHELKQDEREFDAAKQRIRAIDQLILVASTHGQARARLAQKRGYRYARLFSGSVAFLTAFYFSMLELL